MCVCVRVCVCVYLNPENVNIRQHVSVDADVVPLCGDPQGQSVGGWLFKGSEYVGRRVHRPVFLKTNLHKSIRRIFMKRIKRMFHQMHRS